METLKGSRFTVHKTLVGEVLICDSVLAEGLRQYEPSVLTRPTLKDFYRIRPKEWFDPGYESDDFLDLSKETKTTWVVSRFDDEDIMWTNGSWYIVSELDNKIYTTLPEALPEVLYVHQRKVSPYSPNNNLDATFTVVTEIEIRHNETNTSSLYQIRTPSTSNILEATNIKKSGAVTVLMWNENLSEWELFPRDDQVQVFPSKTHAEKVIIESYTKIFA